MNESLPNQVTELLTDLEPITPEICEQLKKQGMKQSDLDTAKRYGFLFNRERNSLVMAE